MLSDEAAYWHEVDRLASASLQPGAGAVRAFARARADGLIAHDGSDDGFAATVLAYGEITVVVLEEWQARIDEAVAEGVDASAVADASRLLARLVLASDIEQTSDELRMALPRFDSAT